MSGGSPKEMLSQQKKCCLNKSLSILKAIMQTKVLVSFGAMTLTA